MKPVKIAAGVMMPVMFLNGSRHPHIDGPAFVPEPQPTNPFILISTATGTIGSLGPEAAEFKGPQFRVIT